MLFYSNLSREKNARGLCRSWADFWNPGIIFSKEFFFSCLYRNITRIINSAYAESFLLSKWKSNRHQAGSLKVYLVYEGYTHYSLPAMRRADFYFKLLSTERYYSAIYHQYCYMVVKLWQSTTKKWQRNWKHHGCGFAERWIKYAGQTEI